LINFRNEVNLEKFLRGCYPGVPQDIDFSNEEERGVLKVSISRNKKEVEFLPTGFIPFKSIILNCAKMYGERKVIEGLKAVIREKKLKDIPTQIIIEGKN